MARRRLLSTLTASVVLAVASAGPAAALDVSETTRDAVTEAAEETVEVGGDAVDDVLDTVEQEPAAEEADVVPDVVEEPVEEVTDAVEEAVAPSPSPSPSPTASPKSSEPRTASATTDTAGYDESLVAAGDVDRAPALSFLTGAGGTAPGSHGSLEVPLAAPAAAPDASAPGVEAPQVAAAPTEETGTPAATVLAEPATSAVPDEGTPVLVLVALASLLAAGAATVREARTAEVW